MTPRERYESSAAAWHEGGRPASSLPGGYRLIALRCWAHSSGARNEGFSSVLQEFLDAANAAQRRDWLDAYFAEQEFCRGCGESYRFENVSFCTACGRTYCYRCKGDQPLAANGNTACACGDGEVVG
jgi:hypothetical protein